MQVFSKTGIGPEEQCLQPSARPLFCMISAELFGADARHLNIFNVLLTFSHTTIELLEEFRNGGMTRYDITDAKTGPLCGRISAGSERHAGRHPGRLPQTCGGQNGLAPAERPCHCRRDRDGEKERAARTQIDADWVLKRIGEELSADMADLYDDHGDLLPIEDWPLIWRQGLVSGVDILALYEGEGEDRRLVGQVKKLKLVDRTRRLELVGKHIRVNAFQEVF